jgi:hypothetical protein
VLISSHRKLLWSKAMVVNVAEKSERDSDRYDHQRDRVTRSKARERQQPRWRRSAASPRGSRIALTIPAGVLAIADEVIE